MLFSEYLLLYKLMGACERRTFAAAVGLTVICMLAFFMTGYVTENVIAGGWKSNLNITSTWIADAASKAIQNTIGSSAITKSKPILVLYWTTAFGTRDWGWGVGASPLSLCPELLGQCEFTSDLSRIKESDILLFHMRDNLNLPPHHLPHQKWVFSVRESSLHTFANLQSLQGTFNMTMTYARSAHVPWCYGVCEALSPSSHPNYDKTFNYAAKKKHLVAWFVSNCRTPSKRETYAEALGKHIDVQTYGCGGKYKCSKGDKAICDRRLNDDYKFYLSFENSLCRDYVTEKLWRILQINVVPIVLGRSNYSDILPPHSYIDVRDFASPRHLADYLNLLAANDTLYNEFFSWKSKYICERKPFNNGCNLCRHALAKRGQSEVVTDLEAEWGRVQNCIDANKFYQGHGLSV